MILCIGDVFQSRPLTSETGSIYSSSTASDDNTQFSSSEYESGSEESTDVEDND